MSVTVSYHTEDGVSRPAIDVKDHHSGQDFVFAVERLIGGPAEGLLGESVTCQYPTALRDLAYERIVSDFWQAATEIAEQKGLGEITQEGRSGGWLVFTDGRDPQDAATFCEDGQTGDEHEADVAEWLRAYRGMVEWADAWIADAPRKVAALAQQMAMDEAGEPAARRFFAFDLDRKHRTIMAYAGRTE
jgi:hypothetical protein